MQSRNGRRRKVREIGTREQDRSDVAAIGRRNRREYSACRKNPPANKGGAAGVRRQASRSGFFEVDTGKFKKLAVAVIDINWGKLELKASALQY